MAMATAMLARTKRVTDPLHDKVKARLLGGELFSGEYVSSGSEHDAGELSGVVDGIFFSDEEDAAGETGRAEGENGDDDCAGLGSTDAGEGWLHLTSSAAAMVRDLVRPPVTDPFAAALAADAAAAVERLAALRPSRAAFRRAVMSSLRDAGYNAAVCKARWESRGGITGGSYEYIDVVEQEAHRKQNPQRYLVDIDFRGEFEIARPTAEYEQVAAQLPRVYVGRPDELKRLLRLLADAAKRSLQSREMHVPPWRKGRYMQIKWLGAYRRTTNPNPSGSEEAAPPAHGEASHHSFTPVREVKCRFVGFDAAPRLAVFAAAARA